MILLVPLRTRDTYCTVLLVVANDWALDLPYPSFKGSFTILVVSSVTARHDLRTILLKMVQLYYDLRTIIFKNGTMITVLQFGYSGNCMNSTVLYVLLVVRRTRKLSGFGANFRPHYWYYDSTSTTSTTRLVPVLVLVQLLQPTCSLLLLLL